jgi:hypothetical protein
MNIRRPERYLSALSLAIPWIPQQPGVVDGSAPIAEVTQISAGLLFWAGASLIPIAAFMAISSRTTPVPGWAATLVVLGNLLWVAASIFLPTAGLIAPNPLGGAFLVGQAGVVAILVKLEFDALCGRIIAA